MYYKLPAIKKCCIIILTVYWLSPFAQAYDVELIEQRTDLTVSNRTLTKTYFYKIKINNRSGEQFAKVSIPYSKLEKVSNIEAYITDEKGNRIKKLDKHTITDRSSISQDELYADSYVKEFTLKHNSYPYMLVYTYQSQQNEFLFLDYWIPILKENAPTHKATLNVIVPLDYTISYENQMVDAPIIDTIDNQLHLTWSAQYKDSIQEETLSPPITEYLPSVKIVPVDFQFDKPGSFASWSSYGDWQCSLLEGLEVLPESEKNKINLLINGITNEKEKIRTLYHFLQDNTRYINITIETGGMKPYPAMDVVNNRYGDCKALTNYFKSVLQYIGILSFYTKVHAANPIQPIHTNFPSQQFNHIILYVPLKQETLWLDCTSDGPFNYLGTFSQNRTAFVTQYRKSEFIQTPSLQPKDVLDSRHILIASPEEMGSSVQFEGTFRGEMFELINSLNKSYSEPARSDYLQDLLTAPGHELKHYEITKTDRDSTFVQITWKTFTANIYNTYGDELLVSNIPFSLPHFEKPDERKLPVQIDFPISLLDTVNYAIPSGYKLFTRGKDQSIQSPYGLYTITFTEQENTVLVIKQLTIYSGLYPLEDYEAFYNFISEINAIEHKTQIILRK